MRGKLLTLPKVRKIWMEWDMFLNLENNMKKIKITVIAIRKAL